MANNQTLVQRVALVIQYQGTHFHGWQRQPNQRTVQEEIEKTIASFINEPVTLHGAGRTDAGVHAAAQVAHFDVSGPIPAHKWATILNSRLANDILIRGSARIDYAWHSRFTAIWRRYRYTIYTDKQPNLFVMPFVWHYYQASLDPQLIQTALNPLIGHHHLAAFQRAGSCRPHSWVDVQEVMCERKGPFIYIEVQASGFLYGMMRLLVGLLIQVGTEELSLESFTDIWVNQRRDIVKHSAPASGLCLLRVGYPEFPFPQEVWYDNMPRFILG
ncbi:MAG: tRNA pseudouridine(38-40) synthase TruA [Trichodesmium sp. St16_bin4-tuft]|nr:tRNA pseudouridine(38-40) synthase TruA [Trichodesmium sp. MAG_R01]MDE5070145.1 tRNA pseudouridine(38-40) synthase TruA [Trichodesmium sp. St4_bin8_1]MDE5074023.1 tRNA pseudouridine(38-40) synthase TruA [Trichodesmium sp. St5_bin8]MDE5079824.1 tRNA pseudouridine(38-40) synthase TruA [Trichodesmium sp. St2_bin6]MDE5092652.1 tRNA pseudouridine(38-40) synthase TruA [Trichodesmium sp. St18_bin3_1_1]MDE5098745.1 tRNA pseudouridine(38-40) synthase TruA [Trichodesmium sp. St16_bin4-tuft]MDE510484